MKKNDKLKILRQIVELEYRMFTDIKNAEGECRKNPGAFKINREARFYPFSLETLNSYLDDLRKASANGRNLLLEKYARIDGIIPPIQETPLIKEIVKIESRWVGELSEKYPELFSKDPEKFKTYLSCELETFSSRTLKFYLRDLKSALDKGTNLAEESYKYLFKKLGFSSFDELREKIENKRRKGGE